MSKPGYIIVEGPSIQHLRGYVNDAILNGYRPIGGVAKIKEEEGRGWVNAPVFVQAMALEGCKP